MIHSCNIWTIPTNKLDALRASVAETERYYETEYPDANDPEWCSIEIIESEPNPVGRIAFILNAPDACGAVSERELFGNDLDARQEPAIDATKLAQNPYCMSDEPFWVVYADEIRWHDVGDVILSPHDHVAETAFADAEE